MPTDLTTYEDAVAAAVAHIEALDGGEDLLAEARELAHDKAMDDPEVRDMVQRQATCTAGRGLAMLVALREVHGA